MAGRRTQAPLSTRRRSRVQVLDALRSSGSASRADLARRTGLSRSTISGLVAELIADGLVVDRDETRGPGSQGGRPGALLSLDRSAGAALAVDFGHTHLRVALADLSAEILAERERAVDVDGSAHIALDAAAELTHEVLTEAGVAMDDVIGIAMGLPGPIDRATGVVGSSVILPDWVGLHPAKELARRLGTSVGVTVDNDANLATLGEARFGAATDSTYLVCVKVSSGIGAGVLLGGRLHRGAAGSAGELGHVLHDAEGDICRCGNRGCLETVAGAGPLLRLMQPRHGPDLTTRRMVELASDGDAGARRVLVDAGRAIGRSLADLANVLGPDTIVVGGDLGGEGSPLIEGVQESLGRFALPAARESVRVVGGKLGGRAELLGGLSLVIGDTERLSSARMGGATR